jgi:hypothetical protein
MRYLLQLLLLVPFIGFAQAETPAQANKRLFDRTIDALNFRTFETVYDKHFTRQKFPENLRTAAARRQFTNFENNADLQKAFLNYNGVAERYKLRFGGGALTQAEFEKQLNSVLRDRNFEFFIRALPRDEKSALIRAEERVIKQATAQFNASGDAASTANVPAADVEPEPAVASAPLTTNGTPTSEAPKPTPAASEPELRSPDGDATPSTTGGSGWVSYATLLVSLGTFGMLSFALFSVMPELNRLRRRVRELETADVAQEPYSATDAEEQEDEPRNPSFFSRLRGPATDELPADNYDDEPTYPR